MTEFGELLEKHLLEKGWTVYMAALEAKIDSGLLYRVMNGKRAATDNILEKLASVEELTLTLNTLRAWRALDEYTLDELEKAVKEAKKRRLNK